MKKLDWLPLALIALLMAACAFVAYAKPVQPTPPKKAEQYQYPDLNYESNWGKMQINRVNGEILIDLLDQLEGDQVVLSLGGQVSPFKIKGDSDNVYAALMPMIPAPDLWDGGDPDR